MQIYLTNNQNMLTDNKSSKIKINDFNQNNYLINLYYIHYFINKLNILKNILLFLHIF